MRVFLTSAAVLGLICSARVHAQMAPGQDAAASGSSTVFAHEPGTGQSGPASARASNIDEGTTRSAIAPHLPAPPGGLNAGWRNYLRDADRAIAAHKTGMAQQALEMAETRLLDRSTPMDSAGQPDSRPMVQQVAQARSALASGNFAGAHAAIESALASGPSPQGPDDQGAAGHGMAQGGMAPGGAEPPR